MKLSLFLKVPLAYREVINKHYGGEIILHDVDHLPYSFGKVCGFERINGVEAIYAFRPKFCGFLERQQTRVDPERLCVHFDGDVNGFRQFCSRFNPKWINGHDRFNERVDLLRERSKEYGLKFLKPVVFSDYSCSGNIVDGFISHKGEDGLFNFHLDYFWPLFHIL